MFMLQLLLPSAVFAKLLVLESSMLSENVTYCPTQHPVGAYSGLPQLLTFAPSIFAGLKKAHICFHLQLDKPDASRSTVSIASSSRYATAGKSPPGICCSLAIQPYFLDFHWRCKRERKIRLKTLASFLLNNAQ